VAFAEAGELGKLTSSTRRSRSRGAGLVTAIFGYGLLALSLFGTNQQPVQRYMTVKNPREAQGALLLGVGAGAIGVTLSLLLGVFLFIFYEHFPALLPADLSARPGHAALREHAGAADPHRRAGRRRLRRGDVEPRLGAELAGRRADRRLPEALQARRLGGEAPDLREGRRGHRRRLGIGVGIYSARTEAPLIDLILTFMGYFAGGLLGLFLLGMLTRRANGTAPSSAPSPARSWC
jgi:solute:Na+ symporter, SSS family